MKILGKQPSREKCAESGWFATDYLLDAPIDRAFILSLRPLGSFVYLDMLKEPFFKIENDYYMIKGVQGKDYFRIAVHGKHEDKLQRLEEFLYSLRLIACRTQVCYTVLMRLLQGAEYETGTRQYSS